MEPEAKAADPAEQRMAVVLRVKSGEITATEGAELLGVSRKTYYEWEARALAGMKMALENRPVGRPGIMTDPEKEALERQVRELREQVQMMEQREAIRRIWKDRADTRPPEADQHKKKP
jgi:polyhydroxyalkanoate synthesis regulator phasin